MATFNYQATAAYNQAGNSINFSQNVMPADVSGTLDDLEMDTTFELNDPLGPGVFAGTLQSADIPSVTLVVVFIEGGNGPNLDNIIIYSPVPIAQVTFPSSLNYDVTDPTAGDTATGNFTTCFGAGTLIQTADGVCPVENLAIGDLVPTSSGQIVPVRWIGRQSRSKFVSRHHIQPVLIRAGALGNGLPHTDLTVTGEHGMLIDGLLINASALVNGSTIDWVPLDDLPETVTYYHVETENHDVILANGAPAETFVDYVGRQAFDNYQEYLDLYGAERIIPEIPQPRISSQRLLPDAIRQKLGIATRPAETYLPLTA